MTGAESITREQVIMLITRYRPANAALPGEATVAAWLTSLAGYGFAECEAALLALGPTAARTATPPQIAARVDTARARGTSPTQSATARWRAHRREANRARYAAAGARGIRAVYAAMGWHRDPDHEQARTVRCPFCHAGPGIVCGPLSRNRAGRREYRDPVTRMHPSRLQAARDRAARS